MSVTQAAGNTAQPVDFQSAIMLEVSRDRRRWSAITIPDRSECWSTRMADQNQAQLCPIVTRKDAMAAGLKRYFTGEPCKRGHVAERRVSNWNCEDCIKETQADWRRANPDRITAYNSKQYAKDPQASRDRANSWYWGNRESASSRHAANYARDPAPHLARSKAYTALHKEDIREKRAIFYAKNADRLRAESRIYGALNKDRSRLRDAANRTDPEWQKKNRNWQAAWRAANIEVCRAYSRNRLAVKKAAGGTHTASDVRDIMRLQHGKCAYCKTSLKGGFHVDHIYPLSKGGGNGRENLQLTCARCNTSKGAFDPIDFARRTGRLI